jgi:hypothetical protein
MPSMLSNQNEKSTYNFFSKYCIAKVIVVNNNPMDKVIVRGRILDDVDNGMIKYIAPSPATHYTSFSGSGMPYPSEEIAFTNTPNVGQQKLKLNKFNIELIMPNSYCKNLCNDIVEPELLIKYISDGKHNIIKIPVGNKILYRSHNYPKQRTSPLFYKNNLDIMSQEDILINSSYPNVNNPYDNFWGLKPIN